MKPDLSTGFIHGLFLFGLDSVKVFFKLKPDDKQTTSDFLKDKIVAIFILLCILGILGVIISPSILRLARNIYNYSI